ncbi:MAG: glycerol-3-phosphate 1-O-acyltransferase PlsY [Eggerthellaceae bacterium]|jgi:glycerol-3-phosphate acyltransferase PlsY
MSLPLILLIVFLISFFLGSIPWGVVISRVFYHTDVREHGSGNIGTTNAIRTMGKVGGYSVFILDFAKGVISGLIAALFCSLYPDQFMGIFTRDSLLCFAFLGCIWGHIFSPWLKFKGGKGIAVAIGCMCVSFGWVGAIIEIGIFALAVVISKYVSLGSILAAIACPFISLVLFWGEPFAILFATLAAVTVLWAHRGNIKRLREGTERKIGHQE